MADIKYTTAYLTSTTPNEEGSFYTPIFIPDNIEAKYPITSTPIPADYQGKPLKYDWNNFKWSISTTLPIEEQLALQQKIIQTQADNLMTQGAKLDKLADQLASTAASTITTTSTTQQVNYSEAELKSILAQATDKITSTLTADMPSNKVKLDSSTLADEQGVVKNED